MRTFWCCALVLASSLCVLATQGEAAEPRGKLRVGVYDNRAIAVAWAPSRFNPVAEKMKEMEQAKAAGDEAKQKELKAWGQSHQRKLHRQGFGRMPVDDLLAPVKDRLPEVARKTSVDAIVWQCDYAGENVEMVDVTSELVELFDPSPKTRKIAAEIVTKPPVDLDEIEKHHDH
ncbi:MAG: hypothetical protein ACOY3P_22225 [Planctomycetota bacterium]